MNIIFDKIHQKQKIAMSDKNILYLNALPIELVYRIFDKLDVLTILLSLRDVCIRLNIILDTYHRYKVKKSFLNTKRNFLIHSRH